LEPNQIISRPVGKAIKQLWIKAVAVFDYNLIAEKDMKLPNYRNLKNINFDDVEEAKESY